LFSNILQAGRKIESERRQVTVILADVIRFTNLTEQIDPEILASLRYDCFKSLVSTVHKYVGIMDKFIGVKKSYKYCSF